MLPLNTNECASRPIIAQNFFKILSVILGNDLLTMTVVCKAVCSLASESGGTIGHLTLTQASGVSQPVQITGSLTGLTAGKHGLSICVSGDLTNGATSCGPIFNPFGT